MPRSTNNQSKKLLFHFHAADPVNVQYRQNEVTPVDYLEFKHHSYSEMIAVSILMYSIAHVLKDSDCYKINS